MYVCRYEGSVTYYIVDVCSVVLVSARRVSLSVFPKVFVGDSVPVFADPCDSPGSAGDVAQAVVEVLPHVDLHPGWFCHPVRCRLESSAPRATPTLRELSLCEVTPQDRVLPACYRAQRFCPAVTLITLLPITLKCPDPKATDASPEILSPRACTRFSLTSLSTSARLVLPPCPPQPPSLGSALRIQASNVLVTHLTIPDASSIPHEAARRRGRARTRSGVFKNS